MQQKCINVYYQDTKRKISYFNTIKEETIKSTVKTLYHIKEPISQIFFSDEDANIIIIDGENIPNELNVHIYIEFDPIPNNPETELNIPENSDNNLLKFHWVFYDKNINENDWKGVISENKYTYKAVNVDDGNPMAVSSVTFSNGKYFFVLRKGIVEYYSAICVIDSEIEFDPNSQVYNNDNYIGLIGDLENDTQNLGVFINTIDGQVKFYDYYKSKLLKSCDLKSDSVKLVGWIKGKNTGDGNGFTILNKGCIEIPFWVE